MTQPVEMIQTTMVPNQEELHAFTKQWHKYSRPILNKRGRMTVWSVCTQRRMFL